MNDAPDSWPFGDAKLSRSEPDPLTHDDVAPVWDAVTAEFPNVIEHITGQMRHGGIGLMQCVRAFHAAAVRLQVPIYPGLLVTMFSRWPEGAFAHRIGTPQFAADVAKVYQECIDELHAVKVQAARLAATLFDPWADLPPPEWPGGVLRPEYEATIAALAKRDGLDFGVLAMAYVVAISGAAHKALRFEPFQHPGWSVPPIIYAMPIADSGFRKTAIVKHAFAAIRRRDDQEWQEYRQARAEWEAAAGDKPPKPSEPPPLIVEDIGVEKLQAVLSRSPRGALILRDEIAPLFDFRRYAKGTGADQRAFYLNAYEGSTIRVHRMSRETEHGAIAAAVFGCCQPARLADFTDLGSDGLLQRFVPLVIAKRRLTEPDTIVRGQDRLEQAIDRLMASRPEHETFCTAPEGSALIRDTELAAEALSEVTDYGPTFQGFCNKLVGLHARLSFLLHLLDDQDTPVIPADTIERAARLTAFCIAHARVFYSRTPGSVLDITKAVAGYILTRPAPSSIDPERFVASTITSGVRVCRGMTLKRLGEVLSPLIAGGWLTPETEFPDCNAWIVTPGLRDALNDRCQAETERRQATRELIEDVAAGRVPKSQRSRR
jgi:hypothetical protein